LYWHNLGCVWSWFWSDRK